MFADPPADKKKPVEHLVVVSDTDWLLSDLETALKNEKAMDGNTNLEEYEKNGKKLEWSDHRFVKWSDDPGTLKSRVASQVTDLRGKFPDSEVGVVFWNGFEQVDDVTTFTHEILVKKGLGVNQRDTEEYSEWVEVPDPLPDDPDHTKLEERIKQREIDSGQEQYTWEAKIEQHHKKAAARYAETMNADNGLSQFLTDAKITAYWIGMPPNAAWKDKDNPATKDVNEAGQALHRLVDGVEYHGNNYTSLEAPYTKSIDELFGFWAQKWNTSLSEAGTVLNVWDAAVESKLYYNESKKHMLGSGYHGSMACGGQSEKPSGEWVDGNPLNPEDTAENDIDYPNPTHQGDFEYSEEDESHAKAHGYAFYSYNDQTYQTLFHIILNSVKNQNPVPVSEEAIAQDMYSISTALSAYVSNTLSPNAGENQIDHKLPDTFGPGNAGALLGYGDKKKGFEEGIISDMSKTSSAIAYKALEDESTKDLMNYARYGRLLQQMGIDEYGIKTTSFSWRTITGSFMMVVFFLSLLCSEMFSWFIDLLIVLNPFRFFVNIGDAAGGSLQTWVSTLDEEQLSPVLQPLVRSELFGRVTDLISSIYDVLTSWSWGLVIPFSLAILIASLFLGSKLFKKKSQSGQNARKIGVWLGRVAFIAIGIPFLGVLYTSTLYHFSSQTGASNSSSTEIVASTFVDFEAWAEKSRLSPVNGSVFEVSTNGDDVGGHPTDGTLSHLRQTVLALNNENGAVTLDKKLNGHDELSWNQDALSKNTASDKTVIGQCTSLLTGYMNNAFYYPSDWETVVGATMTNMTDEGYKTGRRKGGEEEDFPETEQDEKTYYNMFDAVNEFDDWKGRSLDDNTAIFNPNSGKWKSDVGSFNILNNGDLNVTNLGSDELRFTSSVPEEGSRPDKVGGLSTMSMYNFLSSKFGGDGVVMYSNANAVNMGSRYAHRSVTLVGNGLLGALYYANAFVLMLILAIIGMYYMIGSVMNILKKGFSVLSSLPTAALGALKSIATVISISISMMLEVCMVGFLYTMIESLMGAVLDMLEIAVTNAIHGGVATTTIQLFGTSVTITTASIGMYLFGTTIGMLFFGYMLKKYYRVWLRVCDMVTDKIFAMLLGADVIEIIESTKESVGYKAKYQCSEKLWTICEFIRVWLASVVDSLYTNRVAEQVTGVSCHSA